MSNVKMSKDVKEVQKMLRKYQLYVMCQNMSTMETITWHKEVHRQWSPFSDKIWRSTKMLKTIFYELFECFSGHAMWCQNLHHCVWILLCQVKISMNLISSQDAWLFDIFTCECFDINVQNLYFFQFKIICPKKIQSNSSSSTIYPKKISK